MSALWLQQKCNRHFLVMRKVCLILTLLTLTPILSFSQATITSFTSGNWNQAGTWNGGVPPGNTENAVIASGHTVTLAGAETVNDMTIESGATLIDNNKNMTINGNFTLDGTFDGKKDLVLNGAGAWIDGFGTKTNMGNVTISGGDKSIQTTANLNFTKGKINISAGLTVTNNGTVTLNDIVIGLTATATWINATNSTLYVLKDVMTTGDLVASADGNTVVYQRNKAQVVKLPVGGSYYNLIASGTGVKSLEGATNVLGDLTISSTLDVVAGNNYPLNIGGNWTNTGTFEEQSGTVTFDGTGSQTVNSTSGESFFNLTIDKGGGSVTLAQNDTVSGTLTMPVSNTGNIDATASSLTLGTNCSNEGTLIHSSGAIIGQFRRWINSISPADFTFPIGTYANVRPALVTINTLGTCGSVVAEFIESSPGSNGLPIQDGLALPDSVRNTYVEGYWTLTGENGFGTSSYNLELTGNGMTSFTPNASTRLLTRAGSGSPWIGEGAHVAAVGNTTRRTGITFLPSEHAFADTVNCSAPGAVTVTGINVVCPNSPDESYTATLNPGSNYTWTITGGAQDFGGTSDSITVDWGPTGMIGNVRVVENNGCTDGAPVDYTVTIPTLAPSGIVGKSSVAENSSGETYSVTSIPGYTYSWVITGGLTDPEPASGQGNSSITVDWGPVGAGNVQVIADSGICDAAPPVDLPVSIYVVIETIAGGGWNDPSIWNCTCVPGDFDNIRVNDFHTVTLTGNEKISSVIIEANGIIFDNGKRFDISGDLTVYGTYTGSGQLKVKGSGNVLSGSGLIATSGSLRLEGGSTSVSSTSVLTKSPGIIEMRTGHKVTNNGSIVIGGDLVGQDAEATWTNTENSKLTLSGTLLATGALIATATGNTVEYNGGASQTFKAVDYYNVSSTGAAIHVLAADMTAYGDVLISAVNTMNSAGFDIQVKGNWTNSGGTFTPGAGLVTFNGSSGTQTLTAGSGETFGNLTIASGSTVNIPAGSSANVATTLTNSGALDNDGTITIANGYDGQTGSLSGDGTHELTGGNWNLTGSFTAESSTVEFSGGGQTIQGATTFNNLTINGGGASVVADAHNITNTLTLTSGAFNTNGAVTFISDASGTGRIAEITGGSISGNITMQRYIAGDDDWRLMGSPVGGTSLSSWNDDFSMAGFPGSNDPTMAFLSMASYDETVAGVKENGYVTPGGIGDGLGTGKGWFAYVGQALGAGITMNTELVGPTNTGPIAVATTYTSSGGVDEDGWNLISNPYPSDVTWDDVTLSNVTPFAYLWDPNGDSYVSYDQSSGATIPSTQAFWVKNSAPGAGTVTFNENDKAADGDNFYKTYQIPGISLILTGNGYIDSTRIRLVDNASKYFEPNLDAYKLYSFNLQKANLSSLSADSIPTDLSINSMPKLDGDVTIPIRIGFSAAGTNSAYTIQANLGTIPTGACILLEDVISGTFTDLMVNNSYSFTQVAVTGLPPRFLLHISAPLEATVTDVACNGQSDGQIVATAFGNNLTYTWYNSNLDTIQTTSLTSGPDSISGLTPGDYTVIINAPGSICPVINQDFTVTEPSPILITNTIETSLCAGDNDGAIDLSVIGSTPPYSYLWSDLSTSQDLDNLYAGSYGVTITDDNGCTSSELINLASPPKLIYDLSTIDESCLGMDNGSSYVTPSGGVSPYHYLWSNGSSEQGIDNLTPGLYAVSITDDNGCSISASDIEIQAGATVTASYTVPTTTIDIEQGGQLQFTNNSAGATTYIWDFGTGELSNLQNPLYQFPIPGDYEVTLTALNADGCSNTVSNVISVTSSVGFTDQGVSSSGPEIEIIQDGHTLLLKFDMLNQTNASVSLFNILGQVVWAYTDLTIQKDNILLSLDGISQGVYTMQIITGKQRFTQKITIDN